MAGEKLACQGLHRVQTVFRRRGKEAGSFVIGLVKNQKRGIVVNAGADEGDWQQRGLQLGSVDFCEDTWRKQTWLGKEKSEG